jgi:metal-responsive CopG/Arc/MetJ family transcriptional regulator
MKAYTFTLDDITIERMDKYVKEQELVSRSNAIRNIFKNEAKAD